MKQSSIPQALNRPIFRVLAVSVVVIAGATGYEIVEFTQAHSSARTVPSAGGLSDRKISALGKLAPQSEVIQVSAPLALTEDRVSELLVGKGDRVQSGQLLAVLDSHDRLQQAVFEAQSQVNVAQARLEQIKAGAKTGEIQAQVASIQKLEVDLQGEMAAQSATVTRWQAEASSAAAAYDRFKALQAEGAIAAADLDRYRLMLETAQLQLREAEARKARTAESLQAQISEARATLSQISEVRPVDLSAAQAEVDRAFVGMNRAKTALEQVFIRAPIAGQILEIHSNEGESIHSNGVMDMAQTNQMLVIAEVYQTDISRVRVGQSVRVRSQGFEGALTGTVDELGLEVSQQSTFSTQPGENIDRRVVEVKIMLPAEASQQVGGLTNLQVQVEIDT